MNSTAFTVLSLLSYGVPVAVFCVILAISHVLQPRPRSITQLVITALAIALGAVIWAVLGYFGAGYWACLATWIALLLAVVFVVQARSKLRSASGKKHQF